MFIQELMELRARKARALVARITAKNVAIGLGVGAALGMVAGMLLAPKSGKKMREDIAAGSREVMEQVKDQVEEVSKILKRELDDEEISKDVKAVSKKAGEKVKEVKTKIKKEVADKESAILKKNAA